MTNVYGIKEYDISKINEIVDKIFEKHKLQEKITAGKNVVIKPDLTATLKEKSYASVNINLIKAVALKLKKLGAKVTICDAVDGMYDIQNIEEEYSKLGLYSLEENGIELNRDTYLKEVSLKYKEEELDILVINKILEADYIINMPKLKTSTMFGMSGSIVNMFNTIDFRSIKSIYSKYEKSEDISKIALMISSIYKKQLVIMDAIECMHKDGPINGERIRLNSIISSDNMYQLDYFLSTVIFEKGQNIPILSSIIDTQSINYSENLDIKIDENFKDFAKFSIPTNLKKLSFFDKLGKKIVWPEINQSKCINCKLCITRCPKGVIDEKDHKVIMDKKNKCIHCMLCQDVCPTGAIYLKKKKVKIKSSEGEI